MTTINLTNIDDYPYDPAVRAAYVWTKSAWSGDWVARPEFMPTQSVWSVAPKADTASLEYKYGNVILPGETQHSVRPPITDRDYWVLILWLCDDLYPLWWLGQAGTARTRNHQPARVGMPQTGEQTVPCLGMMRLLQQSPILSTVHLGFDGGGEDEAKRSDNIGETFNKRQRGNRTADKHELDTSDPAYLFGRPADATNTTWSTKDIVEHLTMFHWPTADGLVDDEGIPWQLDDADQLADWDQPEIPTDGRSFADIMNQLLPAKKLAGWRIGIDVTFDLDTYDVDDTDTYPEVTAVKVKPFTSVAAAVTLPGVGTVPANDNLYDLIDARDPLTTVDPTEDATDVVDQVIVRGPREIGICTLRHDSEWEDGWPEALVDEYKTAASDDAGYAALKISEKRAHDGRVRDKRKLQPIFRDLRLKQDWAGTVGGERVFPAHGDESRVPYFGLLEILPTLPLYAEVDYEGDVSSVDESSGVQTDVPPIVTLEAPFGGEREHVSKLGRIDAGVNGTNPQLKPFGVSVETNNDVGPGIRLNVTGAPRHALAGESFVGNASDADQYVWGNYDYQTIESTVALRGDFRPFGAEPEEPANDGIRKRVFILDSPTLQLVNLAVDTVVEIDSAGDPVTSDGGVLRDPQPLLDAIAQLIADHQLEPRYALRIRTQRRLGRMKPGDIITSTDTLPGRTINTPISEIKIDAPLGDGRRRPPITQHIHASAYPISVGDLFARL